jgi:hypothetical protein
VKAVLAALGLTAVLAVGAAQVGAAPTRPAAPAVQGNCFSKRLVVLFWPQGHPVLPGVGFPEFLLPHVELYIHQGATTYQNSNQIGYTGTDRQVVLSSSCQRMRERKTFRVLPARSIRTPAAVSCTFRKSAQVQLRRLAGAGARMEVRLIDPPNKLVLRALLATNGSHLSYSFRQCAVGEPPG